MHKQKYNLLMGDFKVFSNVSLRKKQKQFYIVIKHKIYDDDYNIVYIINTRERYMRDNNLFTLSEHMDDHIFYLQRRGKKTI